MHLMRTEIQNTIEHVASGRHLSMEDAGAAMRLMIEGNVTDAQFGALVTALRMKEETPEEIAGMAAAMRDAAVKVDIGGASAVDNCGTGGDGKGWFNVSTAAAIVAASAGVVMAKHGNRAISGAAGSADVLEALGANIGLGPQGVARCVEEVGIAFMFAQSFHPAMKRFSPLRREIGIPTIFNMLGPLTNPAHVKRQVIGCSSPKAAEKIGNAAKLLETEYTIIVHALSGADEIDVEGDTMLYIVKPGVMKRMRTRPADFGLPNGERSHLPVSSTEESAERIRLMLAGKGSGHNAPNSRERSIFIATVINASAVLLAAGKVSSFQEGADAAHEAISSGKAAAKLEQLVAVTNSGVRE